MTNHYETLGLKSTATKDEIEKAFGKLSLKFHPDNNGGDEYFSKMFTDFTEAYEVLIDKKNKSSYDSSNNINQDSIIKEDSKDLSPEILIFESDKDSFEEGESIRLRWKSKNVDKVIIKPFGSVETSGTKVFKLKNYNKDTLSITLHATNKLIDETITKTIKLKNNVIELDFATIQEDEEVRSPQKPKEEVEEIELTEPIKEEPKVYANSFEPSIGKSINETTERFFSSDGRLRRSTYFSRILLLGIPWILTYSVFGNSYNENTMPIFSLIFIAIMSLSWIQTVKRLHDLDQSGWLSLLQLIPLVNIIFGLYLLFNGGSKGPNRFGSDPKDR